MSARAKSVESRLSPIERPSGPVERRLPEKRLAWRFDKAFPVNVETGWGDWLGIARNVSLGGMSIETADPLPLGTHVRVRFTAPGSAAEIVAVGEVKNHYFLNYADQKGPRAVSGMGIRFSTFDGEGADALSQSLDRFRVLH